MLDISPREAAWRIIAIAALALVLIVLLFLSHEAKGQCSKDRGPVKTTTDGITLLVPIRATVGDIGRMTETTVKRNTPRAERERQQYTVTATLVGYKLESDGDYHLVIQDSGRTMIVEAVNPMCAAGSPSKAQVKQVRETLETLHPTSTFKKCHIPVTVTGPLFQDFGHGQTGAGKNMLELHPILAIEILP